MSALSRRRRLISDRNVVFSPSENVELLASFADYHWSDMNEVASRYLNPSSSNYNSQLQNSNSLRTNADGAATGYTTNFNILNAGALGHWI